MKNLTAQELIDSIPKLLGMPNKAKVPDSFEDWLKSNNDAIDIGGNKLPDRIAANHDRYSQQGEERPF